VPPSRLYEKAVGEGTMNPAMSASIDGSISRYISSNEVVRLSRPKTASAVVVVLRRAG
jgi:hypothetical protein